MSRHAHESIPYRAADGVRAAMRLFHAPNGARAPVLVCLPAMGVRGSYYADFAAALSAAGLNAITTDLRGNGSSSARPSRQCDFGYAEIVRLDLPVIVAQAQACFPDSAVFLLGHSLGGQLGALYLSEHPETAEGLIVITTCNVFYKGWPGLSRWKVLGFASLLRTIGSVLGHVPAARLGFAGNEARTVVIDWFNNCRSGRYRVKGSEHDYELSLRAMNKPVLSVSLENDALAPAQAVANFLSKLAGCSVTEKHFMATHPGLERANHFDWAKRPEVVADTIAEWIRGPLSHQGTVREGATARSAAARRRRRSLGSVIRGR